MKLSRVKVVGALAGVAVMLTAPAAMATGSGKVTVGGNDTTGTVAVTGTNSGNIAFVNNRNIPMTCTASSIAGNLNRGTTVAAGAVIGQITAMNFSSCTLSSLGLIVEVDAKPDTLPWNFVVVNSPAPKATSADLEIRSAVTGRTIEVSVHSLGAPPYACAFNANLGPTLTGVAATFDVTNQQIKIDTTTVAASPLPFNLDPLNSSKDKGAAHPSSSCAGQVRNTDIASMKGIFGISTGGAGIINF